MADGQKFCPECGSAPEAEEQTINKAAASAACVGCGAAGDSKFCPECGDQMVMKAVIDTDYDEALDALAANASAVDSLGSTIEFDDPDDDGTEASEMVEDLFKAQQPDADGIVDPLPIFKGMMGTLVVGHNRIVDHLTAVNRETRALRKENAAQARALRAQGLVMKAMQGEITGLRDSIVERGKAPQGPRGVLARSASVNVQTKGLGAAYAIQQTDALDNLGGDPLVMKAQAAFEGGKLTSDDVIRCEEYVQSRRGFTISAIKSIEPEFGSRLEHAIGAVTQ